MHWTRSASCIQIFADALWVVLLPTVNTTSPPYHLASFSPSSQSFCTIVPNPVCKSSKFFASACPIEQEKSLQPLQSVLN
jgi:hypothetical protein